MTSHSGSDADGLAALGICESLLLTLTDRKIISEQDMRDLLADVMTTHNEAATMSQSPKMHREVVAIIERLLADKGGPKA
jgi:hypothetical protein